MARPSFVLSVLLVFLITGAVEWEAIASGPAWARVAQVMSTKPGHPRRPRQRHVLSAVRGMAATQ